MANPFSQCGLILVEPEVMAVADGYRQHTFENAEAGGILVGYRRGQHIHIVEATAPAGSDQRSRYAYARLDESHARHAAERWCRSGGHLDYVGEWHTHPQSTASPSSLDLSEWRQVLKGQKHEMVFWILGTSIDWIGLGRNKTIKPARQLTPEAVVDDASIRQPSPGR